MTSYVFTVIEKRYHWSKVYQSLTKKYGKNFEIVLALKTSNPDKNEVLEFGKSFQRVSVIVFEDDKTENHMVSEAIKVVQGHEMVLCRDYFDYKTIFSDYMLAMGAEGAQVIAYRKIKKTSKFKSFFVDLYNKVVRKIFGFKLYGAEVGLMYFNNIALSVLKELPNNATLTKVNKWAGFEMSYIDIENKMISEPKLEKSEIKPVRTGVIVSSVILALLVAGFVVLAMFKKLTFILGILFIFVLLITSFILFYNSIKFTLINRYGNLR